MAGIGAVAVVVGSFLDWASVQTRLGLYVVQGFNDGDGRITAALGLSAVVLFLLVGSRASARWGLIAASIAGCVGIYNYLNIRKTVAEAGRTKNLAHVGLGLHLVVAGAIVAFVAGLDWSKEAD